MVTYQLQLIEANCTMHTDKQLEDEIREALGLGEPKPSPERRRRVRLSRRKLEIVLLCRNSDGTEVSFTHWADTISMLQGELEARQAAKAEGLAVIRLTQALNKEIPYGTPKPPTT